MLQKWHLLVKIDEGFELTLEVIKPHTDFLLWLTTHLDSHLAPFSSQAHFAADRPACYLL